MRDMSYFYCWETHFTPGMYNENCKRNKLYKKAVDEFLEEIASRLGLFECLECKYTILFVIQIRKLNKTN